MDTFVKAIITLDRNDTLDDQTDESKSLRKQTFQMAVDLNQRMIDEMESIDAEKENGSVSNNSVKSEESGC